MHAGVPAGEIKRGRLARHEELLISHRFRAVQPKQDTDTPSITPPHTTPPPQAKGKPMTRADRTGQGRIGREKMSAHGNCCPGDAWSS